MWDFGGPPVPDGVHFTPDEARAHLAGHGPLLVVLDDVWSASFLAPLRQALPNEACLLITTRREGLARSLRGTVHSLDLLSDKDALDLLRDRLPDATDQQEPLLKALATALGRHAQALDIAGRRLALKARLEWPTLVAGLRRRVGEGTVFGELRLQDDEQRVIAVEAALEASYVDLTETARARFRALGAFAAEATFRTEIAAGVWSCPVAETGEQLDQFVGLGLLTRLEEGEVRWRQHGLLRAYALALLDRRMRRSGPITDMPRPTWS